MSSLGSRFAPILTRTTSSRHRRIRKSVVTGTISPSSHQYLLDLFSMFFKGI
nr:MAG TPA: hypothetical protein [Microviridae sp.]